MSQKVLCRAPEQVPCRLGGPSPCDFPQLTLLKGVASVHQAFWPHERDFGNPRVIQMILNLNAHGLPTELASELVPKYEPRAPLSSITRTSVIQGHRLRAKTPLPSRHSLDLSCGRMFCSSKTFYVKRYL